MQALYYILTFKFNIVYLTHFFNNSSPQCKLLGYRKLGQLLKFIYLFFIYLFILDYFNLFNNSCIASLCLVNSSSGNVARLMYSQNCSSVNELKVSFAGKQRKNKTMKNWTKYSISHAKITWSKMEEKSIVLPKEHVCFYQAVKYSILLSTATNPESSQTAMGRSSASYELLTSAPVRTRWQKEERNSSVCAYGAYILYRHMGYLYYTTGACVSSSRWDRGDEKIGKVNVLSCFCSLAISYSTSLSTSTKLSSLHRRRLCLSPLLRRLCMLINIVIVVLRKNW